MKRRVTHRDIADRLGLDKSSVSLALRNHPSISVATRERVKAMAEELGYRPDPALSTLARQRWAGHETGSGATLAYMVDSRMDNFHSHRRFLRTARVRAEERGYGIQEFNLGDYPTIESAARVLHHRGIRGLLVPQFKHVEGPGIAGLPATQFTVICLDTGWDHHPFHLVKTDTFEETRLVWHEAVQRGFKRIGGAVLSHTPSAMDDATRYGASLSAQREWLPAKARIPLLTTNNRDRDAFMAWFERYRPDVVVGFIPRIWEWLCEAGIKVPQEVAFAAFTLLLAEFPHVSGCVSQGETIGTAGVDALISAMSVNEWGVPERQHKIVLPPLWNEGATLGAGPAGSR
ncbi:MAG: LacI family transcriptional regulator [Puniceicoccaceae bacterium]|nr:MAG: LacI family transcriptional regulator [Puniceicoccaceae bacterium]